MLTQFIAVVLLIASFDACGSGNQNSQQTQANKSGMQTKNSPPVEPKTSATPVNEADSHSIGEIPPDWKISLRTSGGIAGLGAGNLTIESSGKVVFEQRVGADRQIKTCRANLTADETRNLRNMLAEWRTPDEKTPTQPNVPVPDAFNYNLEINSGAGDKLAALECFDNNFETLPKPNKNLIEALSALREKVRRECV